MTDPIGLDRGLTNYGDRDFARYLRRSFARSMGYSTAMLARPVVGIATSASGFNNCHRTTPELVDAVKRGVLAAGGLAIEFPTISLGEVFLNPTSLVFRNLMSMDTEEMISALPLDAVVLIGGCDKTTPGLIMGAISMGLPAIYCPAGPMLRGNWRGHTLGSGSDVWKYWDEKRAGNITDADWAEIENGVARSFGTCMTMGTAATMMAIAEALGLTLPGASSMLAAHGMASPLRSRASRMSLRFRAVVSGSHTSRTFASAASDASSAPGSSCASTASSRSVAWSQ